MRRANEQTTAHRQYVSVGFGILGLPPISSTPSGGGFWTAVSGYQDIDSRWSIAGHLIAFGFGRYMKVVN